MKACMKCYSVDNLQQVALYTIDVDLYLCTKCDLGKMTINEYNSFKKSYIRYQKLSQLGI